MSIPPWKQEASPVADEQLRRTDEAVGEQTCAGMQKQLFHRVKVYHLSNDGQWDDQGTGHATIDYIEGSREVALTVVDEEDNGTLLLHKITSDQVYKKQGETIISWMDPEKALGLALSFQQAKGCSYIWQSMCTIQERLQSRVLGSQVTSCPAFDTLEPSRGSISHGKTDSGLKKLSPLELNDQLVSVNEKLMDIPPLDLSSLPSILKTVLEERLKDQMHVAKLILRDHEFFPKLVNLFRMCEGSRNMDGLHMIFRLVKEIILLNNHAIFHKIFSDDFIIDIIGSLEYDPKVHDVQRHRAFLQEHAVSKEDVRIGNASVASKIHQTYRIGYIKDVILPTVLDDATIASLNSIIHANNALVVCLLKDDASFIQDLFERMRSSNISAESKSNLLLFLHEFCTCSKSLKPAQQIQLSRDLVREGVLDIISDALQSQEKTVVTAGASIAKHFLDQDPNEIRSYIACHEENYQEGNSLLGILVQGMLIDFGEEKSYLSCLKSVLDFSAPDMAMDHKEVVVEAFFDKHLHKLIDAIPLPCPPKDNARSMTGSVGAGTGVEQHSAKPETLLSICELLCFCVLHHPYRIKLSCFTNNLIEKILTFTSRREKVLVVAAIQFMRSIIGTKDDFLISHVINFNLLKPIIEAFVENGNRDNLLHSVVLELLDYIRKENLVPLIEYVTQSFWNQLVIFEQLESIQAFRPTQQVMEDDPTNKRGNVVDMRTEADERGLYKEEDYFNKDRDREDSATSTSAQKQSIAARPISGGLVDYVDDDDDDNDDKYLNPPPKASVKVDEKQSIQARPKSEGLVDYDEDDD